ncbi:hypothetical protein N7G274_006541 [Stereocaulon virgatum]|uniref:Uncharacterized protein n=1 Tax=Stereocaulon virgatum TaxID=373712 RepID=A0ABR4A851_9LECA
MDPSSSFRESFRESSPLSSPPPSPTSPAVPLSPGHPPPSKRQRRTDPDSRRFRVADKIAYIQNALDQVGWSFKDWLNALEEHQEEPKYRQSWLQYRRKAYKQSRLDQSTLKAIIKQNNVDEIAYFFRKELLRLAQTKSFGRYQEPSGEDIDSSDEGSIDFVRELGPDALRQAPHLMRFLALLSRPAHNANKPAAIQDTSPKSSHLLIVSTLLYSIHKKTCNNVPKLTGIYFVNSGMKEKLVDMLSSFGICVSYSNIQETLKVLTNSDRLEKG